MKSIATLAILLPLTLIAQKKYYSAEAEAYFMAQLHRPFQPASLQEVKALEYGHVRIRKDDEITNQSRQPAGENKSEKIVTFLNPANYLIDSVRHYIEICRYTNSRNVTATLFLSSEYDEAMWGEPGYWVRISQGKSETSYTRD